MKPMIAVWLGVLLLPAAGLAAQNPTASINEVSGVSLEGRAVNALTGEPVPQVTVTMTVPAHFFDRGLSGIGGGVIQNVTAVSDASGNFKFENLPPADYALFARKPGFLAYGYDPDAIRPLNGRGKSQITGVEIRLMPQATISGRVLDEFGKPMRYVRVHLLQPSEYFQTRYASAGLDGKTNIRGEFLIEGLKRGKYIILAEDQSFIPQGRFVDHPEENYITTYYPHAASLSEATTVLVDTGQHVSVMDIWMRKEPAFRVSGRVEGAVSMGVVPGQGPQPDHVFIRLEAQDAWFPPTSGRLFGYANDEGQFQINMVSAGSYILSAMWGIELIQMRVPIDVVDSDVTGVTIRAAPIMDITGRVRMEGDGEPPWGAFVHLQLADGFHAFIQHGWSGSVQKDGTFRIKRVPQGKYRIFPRLFPHTYVKQVLAGSADILRTGLDLSEIQEAPVLDVVLSRKVAMIEGVALRDGRTFPNGFVTLVPQPMRPENRLVTFSIRTDRNGRFKITDLPPGDYKLYGWEEEDAALGTHRLGYGHPVNLVNILPQDLEPYDSGSVKVRLAEGDAKKVEVRVASPR